MRGKSILVLPIVVALLVCCRRVQATVVMDWVTIRDTGNIDDNTGYGGVDYVYRMSKYEVTNNQYCDFLNAVATMDTYGLYNTNMASGWNDIGGITRSGSAGNYTYVVRANRGDRPVNYVSFWNACRFANWLHNGQPTGEQDNSTTEGGAYRLNGYTGDDGRNITRNPDALVFIPSGDEWYKAAYYNPMLNGGAGGYYDYPTGMDTIPNNNPPNSDTGNSANFRGENLDFAVGAPYCTTEVGSYTLSGSPYGTFDQAGNLWEWSEQVGHIKSRGLRGGSFGSYEHYLRASGEYYSHPSNAYIDIGFRVAGVPEPTTPPVADADGPYIIYVGDILTLDGSGSTDDDNDIVSYMWDLDDNNSFETDAGGQAIFDVNYTSLQLLGLIVDHTYTIHLKVTDSEEQSDVNDSTLIIVPKPAVTVAVDIKPGSCPNPVNTRSSGVLPVAILGSEDVNVIDIVPTSVEFSFGEVRVGAIRNAYEDVAGPVSDANDCNCSEDGPDGFLDLTLKFGTQEIVKAIGDVNDGEVLTLELTGVLYDPPPYEAPIEGTDCVVIRGKAKSLHGADINKDGVVDMADFAIFAENWLQSSVVDE